ncbi:Ger(x)C family spore germination protein [Wukongibacter sp. M2B1]|uniref:Ger(x)C family spore germination protein n=1 Tax=Wukongibacter sp. M2B1 TaxID=3088895 RepID=UPI003D7B0336
MIKRPNKLLIIFLALFLTGCWDYQDINERSISFSTGVDIVNNNFEFSGEIVKLLSSSKADEQKSQSQGVYTFLSHGKDFEQARLDFEKQNSFPLFLGASKTVIFGEKFAKEGIEPYVNRIDKFYDFRKTLLPVVSRETPKELFKIKVEESISVGFLIDDIISNLKEKKMTVYSDIGEILSDTTLEGIGYMLPYVGTEYGSIKYLGLAVMKNSRLVGIIDMEDTDGILYLLADKPVLTESLFSAEEKNNKYSLRTAVKKRRIKTYYKDGRVSIKVDLNIKAEMRYQYYLKPISDGEIKKIEDKVSKKIKNDILNIFKRSQDEFKCDIFHFLKYFRADHPKIYKQIKWEDAYPEANIEVNIKTKIINLGLMDPNAKKKE